MIGTNPLYAVQTMKGAARSIPTPETHSPPVRGLLLGAISQHAADQRPGQPGHAAMAPKPMPPAPRGTPRSFSRNAGMKTERPPMEKVIIRHAPRR